MQVFVRAPNDEIFTLEVNPLSSCASLRDQILEQIGFDIDSCSIYCDGKYLNDKVSIEEFGVQQQSVIRCDPILAGGAKKRKKKVYSTPKRIKHQRQKVKMAVLKRYNVQKDGSVVGKLKVCTDCGPGVFMANHKNRLYCGRCHTTEMRA